MEGPDSSEVDAPSADHGEDEDEDDDAAAAAGSSLVVLLGLILSCKLVCRPGTRTRKTSVRSRTMFLSWVMMIMINDAY